MSIKTVDVEFGDESGKKVCSIKPFIVGISVTCNAFEHTASIN
jgi:hypothetical protein